MITKKIKQKTIVEQVMEEIKSLIASGQYKVDDKIPSEAELCEMFGVSRPTIREAVKIFNYLGVLESFTGKGTYVSNRGNISTETLTWSLLLGGDELADLLELRESIESRSIMQLTKFHHETHAKAYEIVEELRSILDDMKTAIRDEKKEDLKLADYTFHKKIIEGSSNGIFSEIYSTLQSFMLEEMHQTHEQAENLDYVINEHQAILDGIVSGRKATALAAFNDHMNSECFNSIRRKKKIKFA